MNVKALAFQKSPLSTVHEIFTSQGFRKIIVGPSVTYRAVLRDSSTEADYWLEIPVDLIHKDLEKGKLGKPRLHGSGRIPESVLLAAESKLHDMADYLRSEIRKKVEGLFLHNGRMAHNEMEMKRLGKEMESIKTHAELFRVGLTSDPIQYEKTE